MHLLILLVLSPLGFTETILFLKILIHFQELSFMPFCWKFQTRSKRFLEIQKLRENKQEYDINTAISLLKQMTNSKFVETAEAHFRLNIDPKYNDQQLRATVSFILDRVYMKLHSQFIHLLQ